VNQIKEYLRAVFSSPWSEKILTLSALLHKRPTIHENKQRLSDEDSLTRYIGGTPHFSKHLVTISACLKSLL
jgi:hypothetical protein